MLTFKSNATANEFDSFAYFHPNGSIFQSSGWAACKNNWEPYYCTVSNEQGIVAGSLVLLRKVKGVRFAYMPRGPLLSNEDSVNCFFFKELKIFFRDNHVVLAKADPHVVMKYLSFEEKQLVPTLKDSDIVKHYERYGLKHKGYPLAIADSIQPRIQLSYPIDFENPCQRIPSKTQKKIRASYRKGVTVVEEKEAGNLHKMVEKTEQRHHIHLRNLDYFNNILNAFQDNAVVLSAYSDNQLLASALIVMSREEAEILYSGYDDAYKHYNATYVLRNEAILFAAKHNKKRFNFGGVEGTLDDGLTEFKRSFNPEIAVYIGEFDYLQFPVISPLASFSFNYLKHKITL